VKAKGGSRDPLYLKNPDPGIRLNYKIIILADFSVTKH
jgi:hypothetical protein